MSSQYFKDGAEAKLRGQKQNVNPYSLESPEGKNWDNGWILQGIRNITADKTREDLILSFGPYIGKNISSLSVKQLNTILDTISDPNIWECAHYFYYQKTGTNWRDK